MYRYCNWFVATPLNHAKAGACPTMSKAGGSHMHGVPRYARWDAAKHDCQSNCTDETKGGGNAHVETNTGTQNRYLKKW